MVKEEKFMLNPSRFSKMLEIRVLEVSRVEWK